jgi:cell filamentation protein
MATWVRKSWTALSTNILTANMDPYLYPGTSVLRNLRDIRDAKVLGEFEAEATARRLRQLGQKRTGGQFDARHLQAIHHHIFQDVYEWAGDSGPWISRNPAIPLPSESTLFQASTRLAENWPANGIFRVHFATRGAYYLGEINAIHPFREGNGRTQREFIRELGLQNGWMIDWRQVSQQEMLEASRRSLRIDNAGLELVLRRAFDNEPNRQRDLERGLGGIEKGS